METAFRLSGGGGGGEDYGDEEELELGLGLSLTSSYAPSNVAQSQVVGWPPVKTYRMNSLVNQAKFSKNEAEKEGRVEGTTSKHKGTSHKGKKEDSLVKETGHSGFVKVNMDGMKIGRKVDLNAHSSYETLAQALEDMFLKCRGKQQARRRSTLLEGSSEFVLTYEDKEGDWMLVGDVPWRMFLGAVKRLRIMKTSEANGLGTFREPNGS